MMKCINLWVILAIAIGSTFCGAKQLPSFIQRCKRANPVERNKCMMDRIEIVKPYLIEGNSELNLPPIDPLYVPKLTTHIGNNKALGFTLLYTDIDFYGVKNFQVKELNLDLENGNLFVYVYIPSLDAQGKYSAKGKITVLELDAAGAAQINMTELHIKTNRKLSIVTRNGKEYANLEEAHDLEVTYASVSLHFDDLIKNNKELTEQTNKVINDNYPDLAKEIDAVVEEGVYEAIYSIVKQFVDQYSLDELLE